MPDATTTTNTTAMNWFDAIDDAAMKWYGIYMQNQQAGANQAGSINYNPRGGISASASLPLLIVGGVVIILAVYIWKKA